MRSSGSGGSGGWASRFSSAAAIESTSPSRAHATSTPRSRSSASVAPPVVIDRTGLPSAKASKFFTGQATSSPIV